MLNRVPLLGPIARWNSLADFARLLALLVERAIPLPAAVPLAGGGSRDSDLAAACDEASRRLGRGFAFHESIRGLRQFPPGLGPIVQWGEESPALAEALWTAAEMFDGHVQSRLTLLRTVAPPVTFVMVVGSVFFLISGALSPLVTLIDSLTP
jgi:type II secretory pathway component PulF